MKKLAVLALAAVVLAACDSRENITPTTPENSFDLVPVKVEPVITRATETNFESGDAIGLTISRATGAYATNEKLTFDGTSFSGTLKWYPEGGDASTLAAYYPYAASVPTSFTVESDQSNGTSASDFLSAVKENVLPTANAVSMVFQHKLSRLVVTVVNNSGSAIDAISFKDVIPTAIIDADLSASVNETVDPVEITAFAGQEAYYAIVPPQTVSLKACVAYAGLVREQTLAEATLLPGKQYSISIVVNPADIKVVLAGEIENWTDGGEITPEPSTSNVEEHLADGYIIYAGENYTVVELKDGKWWMSENLRYIPEGLTPSDDLTNVTAGVYYPVVSVDEAGAFAKDEDTIHHNGYLYQAETAFGLNVGDLTSVEQAQALEGAQGICPDGWHIPTSADILALVGKSAGLTTNAEAPYYDGANGSIVKLNEDGFNMDAFGGVTFSNNTVTSGTIMGILSGYKSKISSGMFCGSTYAGVTYNTSNDATSGVKNLQFYGLMPMTNKATEAEYTCNGTKVSYRIASAVRCVRNDE